MHAISHSLTHRGPSTGSRARSRWQPYASSSISSTRSPASYLSTPTSTVSSSPPHATRPTHISQDISRQTLKARYVSSLIDQTVKSLCEIWQFHQIPPFSSIDSNPIPPTLHQGSTLRANTLVLNLRNTQLPSPVSPSTNPTPPQSPFTPITSAAPSSCSITPSNPVPLKSFVQEVLRRSRTSGSVLQTALCYLEAVRRKVPQIALEANAACSQCEPAVDSNEYTSQGIPPPERPLSSPLLCPRRTFLASLILASKFLQDRCYSNRAWAKLSGLSPREIGRCEKALGDALEWRLWVGKGTSKSLVRCRSEQDILSLGATRAATGRLLGRARTLPNAGTDLQPLSASQWVDPDPPYQSQLDPYQEWLVLNQSRISEEESLPMSPGDRVDYTPIQCRAAPGLDTMPTPPTPALVLSPTSTVCSSSSISSFDSDEGERTIQVSDISEPFASKASAVYGWYSNAPNHNNTGVRVFDSSVIDLPQFPIPISDMMLG